MSLTFRLSWPVSGTKGGEGHKVLIKTKDGNFEFVCTVREVIGLNISLTANNPDHFRRLGMFKGAVIQDMQKASTVYAPLSQLPFTYTLSYYFQLGGLTPKDNVYEADITLTNQTATTLQTNPAYHCETLLELLLQDSASHDVFFEFEVTEDASTLNTVTRWLTPRSEEKQSSDESDTEASDGSSAGGEQTKAGGQKDTGKGKGFSSSKVAQSVMPALESTENVSNPTIKGKQVSRTVTVGAHVSVLSQYKYFKSTYFSPSIDRSVEKKVIKILEEEVAVFRLLLQFLYLGQLKPHTSPLFVTRDILAQDSRGVPTWEDVFLTAHRHEVPGLAVLAAEKIVANLDSQWAIPFLFRTGYKFANLRHDVIRFVVANNMPQVVQKELQQTYLAHPGCSAIFGEIMAEMWNVLNRASASPLAAGSGPTFGAVPSTTPSTVAATAVSPATTGRVHFASGAPVTPSSMFFAGTATTTSTAGSPFKAPATNAAPSLPIFNPVTSVSLSSIGVAPIATAGSSSTVLASPVLFATPSTPPQKRV
ncbi:hypothetical protein BGZ74_008684 [Mortierella antarctica]|nr:hypothetical protein BGZ74_008684 [Mortierella antarctica]